MNVQRSCVQQNGKEIQTILNREVMIHLATPGAVPSLPQYVVPSHVIPGELIPTEVGFLKGHGTQQQGEADLTATVSGTVERINKLVSVRAVNSRCVAQGVVVVVRFADWSMCWSLCVAQLSRRDW